MRVNILMQEGGDDRVRVPTDGSCRVQDTFRFNPVYYHLGVRYVGPAARPDNTARICRNAGAYQKWETIFVDLHMRYRQRSACRSRFSRIRRDILCVQGGGTTTEVYV